MPKTKHSYYSFAQDEWAGLAHSLSIDYFSFLKFRTTVVFLCKHTMLRSNQANMHAKKLVENEIQSAHLGAESTDQYTTSNKPTYESTMIYKNWHLELKEQEKHWWPAGLKRVQESSKAFTQLKSWWKDTSKHQIYDHHSQTATSLLEHCRQHQSKCW